LGLSIALGVSGPKANGPAAQEPISAASVESEGERGPGPAPSVPAIPATPERGSTPPDDDELPDPEALSRVFVGVAAKVKPAVVNISTEKVTSDAPFEHPGLGGPLDDFFERFFGGPHGEQRRRSLGSGVIVDSRGYILTNNHVVEKADEIEVQLSDERSFAAEVVGADPETDLAVIRIKSDEEFPFALLGDSNELVVGEWVLAIGNPFGFGHTVTAGIVSAKGRSIQQGAYDDFIQTDAAINPGNSGGPLVDMKGQVVGINSNIISASGGSMGIGFAIPSNLGRKIYDQLVEYGSVTRGWLGVGIQKLTPELARSFKLESEKGAVVSEVLGDDSPAAKAGLQAGDVIVELNGKKVDSDTALVQTVADVRPGETVEIKFYRDGKLKATSVTLGTRAKNLAARAEQSEQSERGRLGVSVQDLTPQLASQLGTSTRAGVVILGIDPAGPAADAGLRRGDIILEANREPVAGVDDLEQEITKVDAGGDLLLRVERVGRGQSSFLWIPVPLD
jgi:serine protease Do